MANYKKIVDVDVLAETSESTNILVEDNGSLKKIPAGNVGGGNGLTFMIKAVVPAYSNNPISLDETVSTGENSGTAYSVNMTFEEFDEAFKKNEICNMVMLVDAYTNIDEAYFWYKCVGLAPVPSSDSPNGSPAYYMTYFAGGQGSYNYNLIFCSDNTIVEVQESSEN